MMYLVYKSLMKGITHLDYTELGILKLLMKSLTLFININLLLLIIICEFNRMIEIVENSLNSIIMFSQIWYY